jgi:hypothetical protein
MIRQVSSCEEEVMADAMPITMIRETFPDEWVATYVTEVDDEDIPVAGVVLTHSPDEGCVFETLKAHLAKHPKARFYTFFTGDVVPEGVHLAFPFG